MTSARPCNKVGHLFWFTNLPHHEANDVILYIYNYIYTEGILLYLPLYRKLCTFVFESKIKSACDFCWLLAYKIYMYTFKILSCLNFKILQDEIKTGICICINTSKIPLAGFKSTGERAPIVTVYHWRRKLCTRQAGEQWRIAHTR